VRAIVLAAGLGTRLRPLTNTIPKCLVDVGGTTLLDLWLDRLERCGVEEVVVNTHHLVEQVRRHVSLRADRPPRVTLSFEPELLGSAGSLQANKHFLGRDEMFLAVYADSLTTFDLSLLIEAHRSRSPLATVTVFHSPQPWRCGILDVADGWMVGFEEKPSNPRGDLANAGIYAFSRDVLVQLDGAPPLDIALDLLPRLLGRARVLSIGDARLVDVGTHEALHQARTQRMDWTL
jgi:mannose-1-phosphate guanylyltransferase